MTVPDGDDRAAVEARLRRLAADALAALVADLWAAQVFETARDGTSVTATSGTSSLVIRVADGGFDAAVLGEQLWYAVDRPVARDLCERHQGAEPSSLLPGIDSGSPTTGPETGPNRAASLLPAGAVARGMGLSDTAKRSFVAGLALVAPLVVTLVAINLVFGWLRGFLNPIIEGAGLTALTGNIEVLAELGALVLLLGGITLIGYLAQRSIGVGVFDLLERLVGVVPMVSVIYSSVRQVSDALVKRESRYESVVLVEYREGLYVFGFITGDSPRAVTDTLGQEAYNVYLPGSPNPTQGQFTLVPAAEVTELDVSVSRAIRLLVTTGIAENEEELEQFKREVDHEVDDEDVSMSDLQPGTQR